MRMVRWLASGLALVALAPSASSAQGGRLFNDSWFWGLNAGAMSFSTATVANQTAPVVNAEWFITKTRGGLYLSVGQAFFTTSASVTDNNGVPYNVQIKDMTQVMADVIALPVAWGGVHLYAGGGFIMNLSHEATITDSILNPNVRDQVQHNLSEEKDADPGQSAGGRARAAQARGDLRQLHLHADAEQLHPERARGVPAGRRRALELRPVGGQRTLTGHGTSAG